VINLEKSNIKHTRSRRINNFKKPKTKQKIYYKSVDGSDYGSKYFDEELALLYGYFSDDLDFETTYEYINIPASIGKFWVRHNCIKCNYYQWETTYQNFFYQNARCPVCCLSKAEIEIRNYLILNNIDFKTQFEFKDLLSRRGNPLKFDFAIFNNGELFYLIEYDGEFHYLDIVGKNNLEEQKYRDNLKNSYCKRNNILLIRIPYWEKEKIEEILSKNRKKYDKKI